MLNKCYFHTNFLPKEVVLFRNDRKKVSVKVVFFFTVLVCIFPKGGKKNDLGETRVRLVVFISGIGKKEKKRSLLTTFSRPK